MPLESLGHKKTRQSDGFKAMLIAGMCHTSMTLVEPVVLLTRLIAWLQSDLLKYPSPELAILRWLDASRVQRHCDFTSLYILKYILNTF